MRNVKYFIVLLFHCGVQWINAQDYPLGDSYRLNDELTVYLVYTLAICPEACDGLVTTVVNGGQPPYYYSWSNGATTAEIQDLCPGSGEVTVTDNSGNTATDMYEIEEYPVPIAFLDTLYITQPSGGLNNGCIAVDSTSVIDTSLFHIDTVWSIDSIHFIPYHIFCHLGPGVYHLYLRTIEGCVFRATSDVILYDVTAVEDLDISFQLFPNPVTTELNVHSDIPLEVDLMDMNGRKIVSYHLANDQLIQMEDYPDGIYILRISDGEKSAYKKIVKTE